MNVEGVKSRSTFIAFVESLRADLLASEAAEKEKPSERYATAAGDWENGTLEQFLEALAAYTADARQISEPPDWRTFAQLLAAAKVYE